MAQLLEHCSLGDDQLKIWKVDCSCIVQDDMRFMQFIHGTTYYDNPYGGKLDLAYWRIYVHNAFHGANLPEIRDYFYFAEVNGTVAARLWFAYAPGNDFGNFGNIFTLHEYRRRGIETDAALHTGFPANFCKMSCLCHGQRICGTDLYGLRIQTGLRRDLRNHGPCA